MGHKSFNNVVETTSSTGTGTIALLGAMAGYQSFGGVFTVGDTLYYAWKAVDSSGNPTGDEEWGLGTYSAANVLTRTTVYGGTNGTSAVSMSAGTKQVWCAVIAEKTLTFDLLGGGPMPLTTSSPVSPTANLNVHAIALASRAALGWAAAGQRWTQAQAGFHGPALAYYLPNNGTTIGLNNGIPWVAGGTVSHPTPATTAPAIVNQMKRTRFANVVTTPNQTLGITAMASGVAPYWRGNAAGLGGFFMHARIIVELWPAATVRLFVGLSDQTTAVTASDTLAGNLAGFLHITTDAASVLNFVTRDGTTSSNGATITLTQNLQAGQAFDCYIYAKPNDSTIYYRLDDVNAGTTLIDTSKTTNLPASTAYMGPQVSMSNGTANITVTTAALGIAKVYLESDH